MPLLDPLMLEEQVAARCELGKRYGLACVVVRPADVQLVSKWLAGAKVAVGSVVGPADGSSTSAVKNYEARDLMGRGAKEIETTLNLGKLVSRQFPYLEMELVQMSQECRGQEVKLKVNIELPLLAPDLRVIACKVLKRAEVSYGRAFGALSPAPATEADLGFLKQRFGDVILLHAGAAAKTLAEMKALFAAGVERVAVRDPAPLLEEWKKELAARAAAEKAAELSGSSKTL